MLVAAGVLTQPRWRVWTALLVTGLALVVVYLPVFQLLQDQWRTNPAYSFGALVPVISGFLVFSRRRRLRALRVEPAIGLGAGLAALAGTMLYVGRFAGIADLQEISLVLMLISLVVLVFGSQFLWELWFPLAYLVLMLPIWEIATDPLHGPSQVFSARIAAELLGLARVPVHLAGIRLDLPNVTLEVASACSGINFVIAVIAVGVPQAYLCLTGWLPRVIAVTFAVAVAVLSNGLRVALIGVLTYYGFSTSLHGPGHILQGLFVSALGFVGLMFGIRALARVCPRMPDAPPKPAANAATGLTKSQLLPACGVATVVLTLIGVSSTRWLPNGPGISEPYPPSPGAAWVPLEMTVPARFIDSGGAQTRFTAHVFRGSNGERIELFFASLVQRGLLRNVTYVSVNVSTSSTIRQVVLPSSHSQTLRANWAHFETGRGQTDVIYWHDLNGYPTVHRQLTKAYAVALMLTKSESLPRLVVAVQDRPIGDTERPEGLFRFAGALSLALRSSGT